MTVPQISQEDILSLGLKIEEYHKIIEHLGRNPNFIELSVFSVMWSEHCSYKSSRHLLKKFPTRGKRVVQGPGENAGIVDIGDNQVAIFKMESHNHPSFIEPYQGAATGVGGILRDIFTMGADPVALLNSLRFGTPLSSKTSFLVSGIVSGIAGYGNCFGCPTVGGDIYFHESYNLNPLVNVFCLGIAEKDKIFYGRAKGEGNPVIYVGSKTGRDGIHGAIMASQTFDDTAETKKPTVQVGDPFTEKLLLEACLELMKTDVLIGIQDMGAAGLTSSSVEMASRAGTGIWIDLSKIPTRQNYMKPEELLLSESQERMLMVVKKGSENKVKEIFDKWDLDMAVIGIVTTDGRFRAEFQGKEVVNIPVSALTEAAPSYERPQKAPEKENKEKTLTALTRKKVEVTTSMGRDLEDLDWTDVLKKMITSPNLCSRSWIYRQFDHQVKTNTVMLPGADAAVIRIKSDASIQKGLAISVDCNSHYCQIDPFEGAMMAVAEGARNVSCVGGEPIGLTDCLNFGNPENPEIMWQFKRAVEGISEACQKLHIPVISGNVSFYNETNDEPIYPTPTIGMVGLISDVSNVVTHAFEKVGDLIVLLGASVSDENLGGSEFVQLFYSENKDLDLPHLDLELEANVQKITRELIEKKVIHSAHDVSEGGLAITLLESSFGNHVGVNIQYEEKRSPAALLFGECPSRVVVSLSKDNLEKLQHICDENRVSFQVIGETIRDRFKFSPFFDLDLLELKTLWENAFEKNVFH